jgi:integrase
LGRRIVQNTIKKMEAPESGNRIEWDSEIHGFGVRITAAGAVSFILDYRIHGRQRRFTIGRSPEWSPTAARDEVLDLRKGLAKGIDPMEERRKSRSEPTLGDLATDYLARYAEPNKRPTSLRNDRQMIEGIILDGLGKTRRLKAVGRRDIETLITSLKKTPYRANRTLSLLSKMFNLAIEWKWIMENPTKGVPRFQEDKRERWLSKKEIQRFREALDGYPDQNAANALRLLLLTGARSGEVLKAEWDHFDFTHEVWTKPSHHTKEKKTEHVPLSGVAISLLRSMLPENPVEQVGPLFPGFPEMNRRGKRTDSKECEGPRTTVRRPWIAACKAAGLAEPITRQGKRGTVTRWKPTVRTHDLRHSYASHLVSNGASLEVVGKLLGHTQAQTTMRYAHLQDDSLRAATNRFSDIFSAVQEQRKVGA